MTLRDYARGLVEVAAARHVLPENVDIARCRPPYNSGPITKWPSPLEMKRLTKKREADSIFSSTVGWLTADGRPSMAGDFGRYTMGAIARAFSEGRKRGEAPDSPAKRKDKFWRDVRKVGLAVAGIANEFVRTHNEVEERVKSVLPTLEINQGESQQILIKRWEEKDPTIAAAFQERSNLEKRDSLQPYRPHYDAATKPKQPCLPLGTKLHTASI